MITYHPYYDIDHTVYRLICLIEAIDSECSVERIQLYDFFLVFPHFLSEISLPSIKSRRIRKFLDLIPKPYQRLPDRKVLFRRGTPLQHQAVRLVVAGSLAEASEGNLVQLSRTDLPLSSELETRIKNFQERHTIEFQILSELDGLTIHGPKGLKARSGLLEYDYDASVR